MSTRLVLVEAGGGGGTGTLAGACPGAAVEVLAVWGGMATRLGELVAGEPRAVLVGRSRCADPGGVR